MPSFPIKEALRLCEGGSFKLHFVHGDSSGYTTISAEKTIELVLGFAFPCEITSGYVSLEIPLGHWEIREDNLGMARYYVVLLLARLWSIKHAPGELPAAPELKKLLDHLKQVPDQDDFDSAELHHLILMADLPYVLTAELDGEPVELGAPQIMEEIPQSVVKCEAMPDGSAMKIWYPDTPDQTYLIRDVAWIAIFDALSSWLKNHSERDPV
jgi:hypothetical protein